MDPDDRLLSGRALLDRCKPLGFYSLLFLSKALAKLASKESCTITVLVEEAHDVTGSDPIRPEKAMILGPARVIPREHPKFACRAIDVRATEAGTVEDRRLIAQLVQTLSQDGEGGRQDRYRDTRGIPRHGPVGADIRAEPGADCLRPYACPAHLPDYWGLGGIGSEIARHLATRGVPASR